MKKSELTAFIKEEILSTLSENTTIESDVKRYIEMLDELKEKFPSGKVKAKASALIGDLLDYINMSEATIETSPEDLAKVKQTADKDDVIKVTEENIGLADIEEMGYEAGERAFEEIKGRFQNQPDHQAYRKGFFQGYIDQAGAYGLNEAEDKEPTKADLKATKGLAKAKEELAQLTKQMKSLARDYKKAEGEEKEKLVADLKKKTKLKKELEAIIDK